MDFYLKSKWPTWQGCVLGLGEWAQSRGLLRWAWHLGSWLLVQRLGVWGPVWGWGWAGSFHPGELPGVWWCWGGPRARVCGIPPWTWGHGNHVGSSEPASAGVPGKVDPHFTFLPPQEGCLSSCWGEGCWWRSARGNVKLPRLSASVSLFLLALPGILSFCKVIFESE